MKHTFIITAMLSLLHFYAQAQTKPILLRDLNSIAQQLTEEQLARLINYGNKLILEPKEEKSTQHRTPKADVFWSNSKYTMSNITRGDILFLPFKYLNTSSTPYEIKDIKSSCGCVTVKKPTEPLLKNETSTLMLHVDTNLIKNSAPVTVLVYDNSSPSGKSYLFIEANIIEPTTASNPVNEK